MSAEAVSAADCANLDSVDRRIINTLQGGFPISAHPYADAATRLGIDESNLLQRLQRMLDRGLLSRFGPLYRAERMGGAVTLAAMQVPPEDLDRVAGLVNALPEVAHNYQRAHRFNLWFVVAVDRQPRIAEILDRIRAESGYPVYDMPKLEEYYIGFRVEL